MNTQMALWLLWCIGCAYSVRWAVVHALRPRIGWLSFIAAYAAWLLLFATGTVIMTVTGFDFKGAAGTAEGAEFIGYLVYIWSPLGLPVALGAGPIVIWDVSVGILKALKRSRSIASLT